MKNVVYICGLLLAAGCAGTPDRTPTAVSSHAADTDDNTVHDSVDGTPVTNSLSAEEPSLPSLKDSTAPGPPPKPLENPALTASAEQCKRRDFSGWTHPRYRTRVLATISDIKIPPFDKAAAVRRAVTQSEHLFDKCQLICPALTVPIEVRMLLSPNGSPIQVETSGTQNEELLSCVKAQAGLLKIADVDLADALWISFVVTLAEPTVRRRNVSPLASMIEAEKTNTDSSSDSEASGGEGISLGCVRAAATAAQQCAYLTVHAPAATEAAPMCRRSFRALPLYEGVTLLSQVTAAATEEIGAAVDRRLSENESELRTCYAEGIGTRMRPKGRISVRLDFTADACGATVHFEKAALPDRDTRRCLKNVLSQLGIARGGFNSQDGWARAAIEFSYEKKPLQK